MNENILWRMRELFLSFFEKKRRKDEGYINKRMKVIDGLSKATGIHQRCFRKIHTEFLANE